MEQVTERDGWKEKDTGLGDCFETEEKFYGAVVLKGSPQTSQIT